MKFTVDQTKEWTQHYIDHGYAHLTGVFGEEFITPALAEVRRLMGNESPMREWTKENAKLTHTPRNKDFAVLDGIYDQPGIRKMIDVMFAPTDTWNGERSYQLFVTPFDPEAKQGLADRGHLDFVYSPIPVMGSGFMFQASLVKSEPFSGNLTVYPGTHKKVQAILREDPDRRYPDYVALSDVLECPPVEFIAEPGDVMLFHHLVGHNGNAGHADNRQPRCTLHCQGLRHGWPREIDPASGPLSPWEWSVLPQGERYRAPVDELEAIKAHRAKKKPA